MKYHADAASHAVASFLKYENSLPGVRTWLRKKFFRKLAFGEDYRVLCHYGATVYAFQQPPERPRNATGTHRNDRGTKNEDVGRLGHVGEWDRCLKIR